MASWELLDPEAEQDLHKARLLNVEEKPFKRLTKRLTTISSLASTSTQPPKPTAAEASPSQVPPSSARDQLKEDITFDFAAFDSSIMRLQFLHEANARERERYATDQQRILAECQDVRSNNAQLREQLEGARATLTQRKKFDDLAEKITSNRLLRPREDQIASLAKLEGECRELERESQTYSVTWGERRDQFNRIMEEGMLLRRQIRDEKEEVDRREGMDEGGQSEAGQTPKPDASEGATPRIDIDEPPKEDGEVETPALAGANGVGTPAPNTPGPEGLHAASRSGSRAPSREVSPMPQGDEEKKDVDMGGDEGEATPQAADAAGDGEVTEDKMEVDS